MQFICEQADLLSALSTVTRAMASRSTAAIFESVKVDAADGSVSLACTDLAIGIETAMSADVREEGSLLLPGRLLLEIVRKLPQGEVTVAAKDLSVTVRAQGSRTRLQGMNANEFPQMPRFESSANVSLDRRLLHDMIRQTSFAAAVEESNPALTGVLLETRSAEITMVALDRFRFALRKGALEREAPELDAIIPARYLNEIARMLGDEEGEVALGFSKTHVALELGRTRVTVRLLDGAFVKYRQLIPAEHKVVAKINRETLADCVDRAALIARETKSNLITMKLEDNRLVITSQSENSNIYEELPIELEGSEIEIAFNVRYVADALKCLTDDVVAMRFTSPVSPCVLTPVDGDEYLYLLLPVRVFGK